MTPKRCQMCHIASTFIEKLKYNVYKTFHFSFEVSARGQITKSNRARIKELVFRCCADPKSITKLLGTNISKAALLSSFSLFCARNEPSWVSPNPLIVRWQFFTRFFSQYSWLYIIYWIAVFYFSITAYWCIRFNDSVLDLPCHNDAFVIQ